MSSLEHTIEEVINEAAGTKAPVPNAKGSSSPEDEAPKKAADSADKAGEATSKAKAPGGDKASEKGDEVKDGVTKKDDKKAANEEEEVNTETPSLEEMSKSELLKAVVAGLKEMDSKTLKAAVDSISEADEDGGDEEKSESLSRNALIRSVVETLKDKSIKEVQDFIKSISKSEEVEEEVEEESEESVEEAKSKKDEASMDDDDEDPTDDDSDDDEEEEEESESKKESYEVDMTDDIDALVADEDLSEEFKNKAKTIFEAAVTTKVKKEVAQIEEKYEEDTKEAIEEIKEDLTEKVDSYLNYVAENWVTENELAIERGLKTELTEDFINGLKKLFEEHYVEVPEDKFDVVEELANRLDDQEDKLNEEVAQNISLSQDIEELKREKIISEASNDLADSEQEKLKELAEDVDYENEENFVEKVSTLKEAYFKGEKLEAVSDESNVASSDADFSGDQPVRDGMTNYTAAISKFAKLDN